MTEQGVVETTFGVAQTVADAKHQDAMFDLLATTETYMEKVNSDSQYMQVKNNCQNRNEACTFWSVLGECEKNPGA
jgi:hypothetical protein